MDTGKKLALQVELTPDPDLFPVVRLLVARLAEQMKLRESQRLNLQQGVAQICRRAAEQSNGATVRLQFVGFADRLEVVAEGATGMAETDLFLLNQLLDRVSLEEAGGQGRLTLVQYLARVERQP